ncbi:MAG: acetyl-CoA carboxylase biotin carboxyl carrier protein [Xanthobacteraceae bacterium]
MSDAKIAIDHELIRDLAGLLDETGLGEIEIEQHGMRIRVARGAVAASFNSGTFPAAASQILPTTAIEPRAAEAAIDLTKHPGVVISPMVGTAYRAGEPGGKPYVDIGTAVKVGDNLLIIEAMKTMNQIPAPRAGTVTQILFDDGQPVEYGEPLIIIE